MAAFYSELESLYLIIKITETADTLSATQAKCFCTHLFLTTEQGQKPDENLRLET